MSNDEKFEGAAHELLRYLKEKKQALQIRHTQELTEVDRQIEAVSTTVGLLREAEHKVPVAEKGLIIPSVLKGKSARAACVEIAKLNNGIVRVSDARDALLAVGILKKRKNAWGVVYTTLNRSDDFEKGPDPGSFRLVGQAQPRQEPGLVQ